MIPNNENVHIYGYLCQITNVVKPVCNAFKAFEVCAFNFRNYSLLIKTRNKFQVLYKTQKIWCLNIIVKENQMEL